MAVAGWITVRFYTQTDIVSGFIYQPEEERILDLLNGVSVRQPESRGRFLELGDVTIKHADGKEERLPAAYVNKATVQLVTTPDGDSARGIGAKAGHKPYPFVEKSPVLVRLHMPGYTVAGTMHRTKDQRVWHVLEEKPMFLPFTNAEIHTLANDILSGVPFVAVNKEQIMSVQEEEIPLLQVLRSQPEEPQ